MKSKIILVSMLTLFTTACGKANKEVVFGQEKSSVSAASLSEASRPEGKSCESEEDLRAKRKSEFVCLYEGLNYTGEACCVARENNERLVQIPDNNPRSLSAASLVHFGGRASLGLTYSARIQSQAELECLFAASPSQLQRNCPHLARGPIGATSGIWGATNRLSSYSDDNDPTLHFFGVKTLIFFE